MIDALIERYDAVVVGAGQAGPALAARLGAEGLKTALVERKLLGGTCVNNGCIPTKTLVGSARAIHMARRGGEYGFSAGDIRVDMKAVKARKDGVVRKSTDGLAGWIAGMKNVTLLRGHARFAGPRTLDIDGQRTLQAERIFLNVGGRAVVPDIPGIRDVPYLVNTSMMELDEVPAHLVIIGGSYIGLEFAQMYRRFGAKVTIVERQARLIPIEDDEVSQSIREILQGEGIDVRTSADCIGLQPHTTGVAVSLNCAEGEPQVVGSHVLLAVGRRPNVDDLGLERAGVALDARGNVQIDESLATNVPGIWALGECNGHGAFTHTAYNDYEIAAANLLDGERRRVTDRILGYGLFIDPPLGRVGMTERQARATGRRLLVGARPMTRVNRAVEKDETQGLMKIVVDADSRQILGAAILGPGGDEAIHGILDAMNARTRYTDLQWAVPIHPTVSELIPTVLRELKPAKT
jgi:pyruvate/2-oxoglutarate dehydrogenase complex dihydrolipoamide dehydrogenase (E3) component